ncbi:hypothetical protein A5784_20380 [Mycobacterium sp. 852013-50091_SCH5140682]|uniref:hypothetical protein n=1 Tax=Mycobacterium sp. 852013-50091_SCH5140682 TaxID=1834109 RepID=UPI0007EBA093|nr:hypothetical protein [Mycobacterium sp. 852013-50091_SCH5140682]OBC00387.1 hypothetical protein A5784_20380 [Mycobacterium sp. 852013-50091_SCH5140682]
MSTTPLQPRTRLFARVLGPYLLVAAVTVIGRGPRLRSMVEAFAADPVWPWVTGAFVLPMGLIVIALHSYWRGPAAIIVSVLGWLTTFKGLALLAFPQAYLSVGQTAVSATLWWQASSSVIAIVGLYLTYVGWTPTRSHPSSHQSLDTTPDLPRAA